MSTTLKQSNLKSILESKNGVHLTAYLVNRGDLIDLKSQLKQTLDEAYEWLHHVLPIEEKKKFLEPIESLLNDAKVFKQMKGNIGLFRNENFFRILNIPIEIERSCQVATTFHVKPLLRWFQGDQEFLLLTVSPKKADLYIGSKDTLKLIDRIEFEEVVSRLHVVGKKSTIKRRQPKESRSSEIVSWVSYLVSQIALKSKPKLFLAGDSLVLHAVKKNLKYDQIHQTLVAQSFSETMLGDICQKIRVLMKDYSQKMIQRSLLEFRLAEAENKTQKNLFQITKAVVEGKVRKLIVTDELNIFGKIDQKSGGLALHPFDLDHEDDCVLDDLAQMVLSQGGEVIVAKQSEIPKGRPILAILDNEFEGFEKFEKHFHEEHMDQLG